MRSGSDVSTRGGGLLVGSSEILAGVMEGRKCFGAGARNGGCADRGARGWKIAGFNFLEWDRLVGEVDLWCYAQRRTSEARRRRKKEKKIF